MLPVSFYDSLMTVIFPAMFVVITSGMAAAFLFITFLKMISSDWKYRLLVLAGLIVGLLIGDSLVAKYLTSSAVHETGYSIVLSGIFAYTMFPTIMIFVLTSFYEQGGNRGRD
ncbi:hypothetical protein D2T29_12375 [Sinirhodobacter populi]|uniref:Uncharacterized protein n=1 Tax=Paenirhodobacter populi TaxID=2306993 RepID=A0A443KCH4_9RHOB|nr:hypothetical protein [Sinirhodobacter populi]RWR30460.1 hypothetical protein D2T29_12375 [Sinirhodobacter populi]